MGVTFSKGVRQDFLAEEGCEEVHLHVFYTRGQPYCGDALIMLQS